ncbi:ABC transporter permease [Brevibacillus fluminis]|uniref:ABC transporter permease n=1 Tax=Brevibacillus fluminis TaxID=511487 RepID=A0A3M8D057_9BACL|nr:ABC transporter permease [Brevibacillus fluminis]RNB81268.1 ABC transporter permease [Brevibacillus fluminis]
MGAYSIKRLTQGLLLIITVSYLAFALLFIMPGDPIDILTGDRVPPEKKAELRISYGLDKPMYIQYYNWLNKVLSGDFGNSIKTKQPVAEALSQRIPLTLKLVGIATVIQVLLSIPLGLIAAYKKDSWVDRLLMTFASVTQVIPNYWLGILLILLFSITLKWLPMNGYSSANHFILPIISVAFGGAAGLIRLAKTEVLDVFREKYVLTAYAKGLSDKAVILRHVLRNSLILIVTLVFMDIPWIISGAVIIENVFVIPGMGSYLTNGITNQDFPVVQACVLIITVLTVLCNLASDLINGMLDPRIRMEISRGN